jgi:folate-binding protein YgfZ
MATLHDLQVADGARFTPQGDRSIAQQFGTDALAQDTLTTGVVLCDRSHWGRLRVSGADRLRFLHNQTTNAMQSRQPGESCETVFVTSTARTLDLTTAHIRAEDVLLLTSPGYGDRLMQWMDRFIFFADKVDLADVTDQTVCFSILGPGCDEMVAALGGAIAPPGTHRWLDVAGQSVLLAAGSGLATPGYTLMGDREVGARLWQRLREAGAVPMGQALWDILRIAQGRPMPEAELTEDYNPLEAGLWHAVSFAKGCYIGQETIARLDTYNGVKQQLWGIHLSEVVPVGTPLMVEDAKVGRLTSVVQDGDAVLGLAYLRTKAGGAGVTVQVGTAQGTLVDVPFLTRSRLPG